MKGDSLNKGRTKEEQTKILCFTDFVFIAS